MSSPRSNPRPLPSTLLPSALPHEYTSNPVPPSPITNIPTSHAPPSPATYSSQNHLPPASASSTSSTYPPSFQPFFTLISDSNTSTSTHPSVSYIFSDDDHEAITAAAVQISHSNTSAPPQPPSKQTSGNSATRRRSIVPGTDQQQQQHDATQPIERCVLVTLGSDGRSVVDAVSLTPDWHVDAAELSLAPTLNGDGGLPAAGTSPGAIGGKGRRESGTMVAEEGGMEVEAADAQLMLQIRGSGVPMAVGREEALGLGVDGLAEVFRERLAELKKVVEAAEREGGRGDGGVIKG